MKNFIEELKTPLMYSAVVLVCLSAYHYWQEQHMKQPKAGNPPKTLNNHLDENGHLVMDNVMSHQNTHPTITIQSDKLNLKVALIGGVVVGANLPQFTQSLSDKTPVTVLTDKARDFQVVGFGVVGDYDVRFHLASKELKLKPNQNELKVVLAGKTAKGIDISKELTLKRGQYDVQVSTKVANNTKAAWSGHFYQQIKRAEPATEQGIGRRTYHGMSFYQDKKPYTKLDYSDMRKRDLNTDVKGGWVAGQQHYFLTALIAPKGLTQNYFSSTHDNDSKYVLGMFAPKFTLAPGETTSYNSKLYVGPEDVAALDKLAPGLGMTIDYGFLWFLSDALMWILRKIQLVVGNWGVAIMLTTLLVKLVFYGFSDKSFRSMARMSALAPKIKELQEQHKDDKQKLQQAMMEFYAKEKLNPMSGCFPMLVQLPFFIALYWMLIESVELRQAPFFGWIHDLSVKDPMYILPLIMGGSMLLQQLMSDTKTQDSSQKQMMMIMPIVFTFVFMNFPAGLVLYMLTNNILSMAQQAYVKRQIARKHA